MRFVTIGCRARYDCAGPPLARNHCIRAGAIIRYCGKQTLNDRVGWARQSAGRQADAAMEISYAAIGAAPPGLADKCDHGVAVAGCPLSGGDLLAVRPASIAVAWRRDAPSMRAAIEYAAVLTVAGNA